MTKDEFIENACKMGYCNKKQAEEYCKDKETLTDDDYIGVFRYVDGLRYRYRGVALHGGGTTSKHYFRDGGTE